MKYAVKIRCWNDWVEEMASITETIYATNYVEALRLMLDKYDFTDEDIENVEIKAVIE